jgi:TRAP-type C4-dicarboxylate transport system substrate-binding protein
MALPLSHSTGAVLISSGYFNKLPQKLQGLLTSTFDRTMTDLTSELREQTDQAIQLIRDSGVTILPVPKVTHLEGFYRTRDVVARKLSGEIYPKELLESVYRILKRPSPELE